MFDKLTIRTKLIAMVAAPLAVLVVLAAFGSLQRRSEASQTRADASRIEVVARASATGHEIQVENLLTAAFLGGQPQITVKVLDEQRAKTDAAAAAFRSSLGSLGESAMADLGVIRAAQGQLGFMADLRDQVDRKGTAWPELVDQYLSIEEAVLQVTTTAFASDIQDPELSSRMANASALTSYKSAVAKETVLLTGVLATGSFQPLGTTVPSGAQSLWSTVQQTATDAEVRLAVFTSGSPADTRSEVRNKLSGDAVAKVNDVVREVRSGEPEMILDADPVVFRTSAQEMLERIRGIEAGTVANVLATADANASAASQGSRLYVGGALLAALLCLLLAVVVSSSITRPLGKLTAAVDQVAKEQLPRLVESLRNPAQDDVAFLASSVPKIEVGGGVELGHLAEAVGTIQQVAVEVATEQASLLRKGIGDMFVNLARRNQTLLDRQIEYIDELESNEADPDHLENLYKLDHMATRMRRNAESLLVLAGAEPTRRRGRPVPLADVVRAALGEVEDYSRIDLLGLDEVLVKSTAALDVAHLLSELMENATHFSPPDTRVEVVGHRTKSDGYVVSISDHGIGMTAEQLAESNHLLANPPLVGLAMSRSLGFIVIGRLSQRFAITVRLMPSPTGGITSVVAIPADVITEVPPSADDLEVPSSPSAEALASVTPIGSGSNGSGSILPPLEFTTFGSEVDEYEPATLEEAVPSPSSASFEDRMAEMAASDGDRQRPGRTERAYGESEPRSRAIDPSTVAFGVPAPVPTAPAMAELVEVGSDAGPVGRSHSETPIAPTNLAPSPLATRAPAPPANSSPSVSRPPANVGLFGGGAGPDAGAPTGPMARPSMPLPESLPEALPEALPELPQTGPEPLLASPEPLLTSPEPLPGALPSRGAGSATGERSNGALPTPVGESAPAHPDVTAGP